MGLGGGDKLAQGAHKAQFNPATVSDDKFKEMFGEEALRKLNIMDESDREKLVQQAQDIADNVSKKEKPKKKKIRALQDRVIVTRFEEEETINGLYVPDEGKEKPAKGIVVAVGPGRYENGYLQKLGVAIGDKVAFGKFSGAEIQIGFEHYLVLREEDMFLIEEDEVETN